MVAMMCSVPATLPQHLTKNFLREELDLHRGPFQIGPGKGEVDLTSDPRFSGWKQLLPETKREQLLRFSLEAHDTTTDFVLVWSSGTTLAP